MQEQDNSLMQWAQETIPMEAYTQEHAPADTSTPMPYGIKVDSRTATSTELKFQSIEADTNKAILLNIVQEYTGEELQEWFPKKLCSNLDTANCTIRVWSVFLEDKKAHLFEDSDGKGE